MINKNGSMRNRLFLFCSFILLACFSVQAQVSFGEAKKIYLDILATMAGDAAASRYRRQLYTLLY